MCCASVFCEEGRIGRYRKWDCEVPVTSIKMSLYMCMCICMYILACGCTHACSHPSPLFSRASHSTTICEGMCLPPVCIPCNIYLSVQHILVDLTGFTCHLVTETLCSDCDVISPILFFLQGIDHAFLTVPSGGPT